MADEAQALPAQIVRGINWRDAFPFTHLFRAFRVAVHPSKLFLALAALLLIYAGGRVLDGIWPVRHQATHAEVFEYVKEYEEQRATRSYEPLPADLFRQESQGVFITFFKFEVGQVDRVVTLAVNGDAMTMFWPVWHFLAVGPGWLFHNHPWFALLFGAWFLLIWSVFGGAISRIAAVHVARDEKISVRQAMGFSSNKLLSFIFAPLIPAIIIIGIGALIAAISWVLLHIPYVGPVVAGAALILALVGGFVMTLVLLGTLGGFSLMYPTIGVEGSDSFDAISRSFSYVFARPWRMLFYTLVAIVYGALSYLFVKFFIYLMLAITHYFISWWLGGNPAQHWQMMWPRPNFARLPYDVDWENLNGGERIGAGLISFWVYLTISMLGAFAISFYFSANTIIYYLMRREVDATEMDDVYVEETDDEFSDGDAAPTGEALPAAPESGVATTDAATGSTETSHGVRAYPAPESQAGNTGSNG